MLISRALAVSRSNGRPTKRIPKKTANSPLITAMPKMSSPVRAMTSRWLAVSAVIAWENSSPPWRLGFSDMGQ
jgi:hypothetical protein